MWPEWIHWLITIIPSIVGAFLGVFLPSDWKRYPLGWLGASIGFGIGICISLILDPPLVVDPAIALITVPVGNAIYGVGPFIVAICVWWVLRRVRPAVPDVEC